MPTSSGEQFKELVAEHFGFLEERGFASLQSDTTASGIAPSVTYAGRFVALRISLDVRDGAVDARVVRVREGQLHEVGEGAYSRDLFAYLIERQGFRGAPHRPDSPAGGDPVARQVQDWAYLLTTAGAPLLDPDVDPLP